MDFMTILCVLSTLISLFSFGQCALSCHQCTTRENGAVCSDYYDAPGQEDNFAGDCGDSDTHCVKYKTVLYLQDSGTIHGKPRESSVVARVCANRPGARDGCTFQRSGGGFMFTCLCSGTNCNHVGTVLPSMAILLGSVFSIVILQRLSNW